jgi:hypothetical protein
MRRPLDIQLTIETVISEIGEKDDVKPRDLAEKVKLRDPTTFAKIANDLAITALANDIRKLIGSSDGPRQQLELFGTSHDIPEFIALSGLGTGRVWRKLLQCPPSLIERNIAMRDAGIKADAAERDRIRYFVTTARDHGCGFDEPIVNWLRRIEKKRSKK